MNTAVDDNTNTATNAKPEKPTYRLTNWFLWGPNPGGKLTGYVHNHPKFKDGEGVTTSRVIAIRDGIAETQNTFYILGEPN